MRIIQFISDKAERLYGAFEPAAPGKARVIEGDILGRFSLTDRSAVIRKILPLSLTFDHRVTDGVDASLFLAKVIGYLEDPALLFIESA